MNNAWILLFAIHGCVSTHIETRAYGTEVECHKEVEKLYYDHKNSFEEVQAQCESVDSLLQTTKGE